MISKSTNIALLIAVMLFGFSVSGQAISLTVGSGDYYVNVGDYDYLPYANQAGYSVPGLNFQTAMGQYGTWMSMQPFGQVWQPYAASDWRPYTRGHWTYTSYGPTWVGYEPWAWASDHYGNWVFSQQAGWVWIPGYDWHPGRVAWSQGYNSIGWMPLPPAGYDYSRGYLANVGPQNQFTYYDDDFSVGIGFGGGDYSYGGPYYDPRYRPMYYNNAYLGIANMLWSFMSPDHFGYDNYSNYYYGDDYARYLFDRRLVRISSRPVDRVVLERIVRRPITVRRASANEIQIDGRRVRVVAIEGEQENIRKNANVVVREDIAPAFAQKGKAFKAEKADNRDRLVRALRLDNNAGKVETVTGEQIVQQSRERKQRKEQQRTQIRERKKQEIVQVEKQGKIKEKKGVRQTGAEGNRSRSTQVAPPTPQVEEQEQPRNRNNRPDAQERNRPSEDIQKDQKARPDQRVRPAEEQEKVKKNRPVENETDDNRRNPNNKNEDEDVRLKDKDRQPNVRPETDENVQRENREQTNESSDVQRKNQEVKKDAESPKSKKAKPKNTKDKEKDKDKEQNQDEPPPE